MYFIDYSESEVLPCQADDDLVIKYTKAIDKFKNEIDLWKACAEMGEFAKDGVAQLRKFTKDEMNQKIGEAK